MSLQVQHPAAKMLVMASHMQEQEAGDGTNFVVVFAGALLELAEELLRMGLSVSEVNRCKHCVCQNIERNQLPHLLIMFFHLCYRWLKAMRLPVKRPLRSYQIVFVPQLKTSMILMRQGLSSAQQLPVNNMAMKNSLPTSLQRPVVSHLSILLELHLNCLLQLSAYWFQILIFHFADNLWFEVLILLTKFHQFSSVTFFFLMKMNQWLKNQFMRAKIWAKCFSTFLNE